MANKFLSDLDGPYQTQAPDDWSWLDYIKAGASDTGNALSNLAGGIIGGMSPFHPNAARAGQPSYQVPPMLLDAWEAINAPGKILNEGMTVEDRDRTATNAAGFMMGGGLVAPKPSAVRPNARLSSLPADELASLETGWPVAATYGKRDQFGQIREFESYLPPTDIMMRDMRNAGDIDFDYMMRRADNESAPLRGASDIDYLNALGRQINDRDGDLFSNGSKGGAGVGNSLVESQQGKGFTAYHGSPHDFDKFSLDKIGTGEGAQAYGHGLYFADNEGVAKSYRDSLAPDGLGVVARGRLRQHGGDIDKTIEYMRGRLSDGNEPFAVNNRQGLAELEQAKAAGVNPGKMYQVRINADPESFLDWDKPLSQQSEAVQSLVQQDPMWIPPLNEAPDNLMRNLLRAPETTNKLREAGVPGVRYLDGNSRGAGQGSSNYVVFDESLIDILKKYGLTGGAVGAGSLLPWEDQNPTTY